MKVLSIKTYKDMEALFCLFYVVIREYWEAELQFLICLIVENNILVKAKKNYQVSTINNFLFLPILLSSIQILSFDVNYSTFKFRL